MIPTSQHTTLTRRDMQKGAQIGNGNLLNLHVVRGFASLPGSSPPQEKKKDARVGNDWNEGSSVHEVVVVP